MSLQNDALAAVTPDKASFNRVNFLIGLAVMVIMVILWLMVKESSLNKDAQLALMMVLGRFLGYIDSIFAYEFNTTRSEKVKDKELVQMAKALPANNVAPAPQIVAWEAGKEYKPDDLVLSPEGAIHVCMALHTSSDWITDLAAGKWAPKP